jgi:hypothetical protein
VNVENLPYDSLRVKNAFSGRRVVRIGVILWLNGAPATDGWRVCFREEHDLRVERSRWWSRNMRIFDLSIPSFCLRVLQTRFQSLRLVV